MATSSFSALLEAVSTGRPAWYKGLDFHPVYVLTDLSFLPSQDEFTQRVVAQVNASRQRYLEHGATVGRSFAPGAPAFILRDGVRVIAVLYAPTPTSSPTGVVEMIPRDEQMPYKRDHIHDGIIDALLALGRLLTKHDAWTA
jgi:hypothetical protein